ncbi:MAG: trigger factor [Candidatus Paceibacterota bacterium]|jgi:trigger factor
MKISVKKLPKSLVEISVEVGSEEMSKNMDASAKKMAAAGTFDGFRQGKAPVDVVYQRIGKQKIFEDAVQTTIERSYGSAVKDNKLIPIGYPKAEIKKAAIGNELIFDLVVTVLPEVRLGDYSKIKGKAEAKKVTSEDVETELKALQKKRAKYITKEEPASKGDRIEIDFESRLNGVKVEGGESKNHPLVLGNGMFVPGFEDNLAGMKKDESKEFNIIFPKDYYKKELAEKNVNFKVTMKLVQKVELPELNDEFAKSIGKFDTLEILKKNIEEGISMEEKMKAKNEIRKKLIDEIVESSKTEIPDVLIESEKDNMIHELEHNVSHMGVEFDIYLKSVNTSIEKLRSEWSEQAEKRVKANLVIGEIAKKEEIKATEQEIEEKANETLRCYPNEEEVRKKIDINKFKDYIAGTIINEKVFELLEDIAQRNAK